MTASQLNAPVVRAVHVRRTPADAFRIFTERIGAWWPMDTHSVFGSTATVAVEDREVVERSADGQRSVWAEVIESDPPWLLVWRWHPGTDPAQATSVRIEFVAEAEGTRVELTHTGWEVLGERAAAARVSYDEGWATVLGRYQAGPTH